MKTKMVIMRIFQVGGVLGALSCAAATPDAGAETVTVHLMSGRSFTAEIDARTDDARLWLRFDGASTTLYRPIAWDRVVRGNVAGRDMSAAEIRAGAKAWRSTKPTRKTPSAKSRPVTDAPITNALVTNDSHARWAARALDSLPAVASIEAEAALANWDADVEMDGLVLRVTARDREGNVVALSGIVEAKLHAVRTVRATNVPGRNGRRIDLAGRWTRAYQQVRSHDDAVVLRLPFQTVHPEFQLDVRAYGLLQVQLTVPGQGVFHTTVRDVRIRPFSQVRDEIQHATGQRFLPSEPTQQHRR